MASPFATPSSALSAWTPSRRATRWLLGAASWIAAALVLVYLATAVLQSRVPFDEDEAAHATSAFDVWQAASRGSMADLGAAIARQGFYPPLHSLVVALSYGVAGPTLASSRLPSVIALALAIAAVGLASRRQRSRGDGETTRGNAASGAWVVATIVVSTSPICVDNAVLCMLEPLALAGFGVLLVFAQSVEDRGTRDAPPGVEWQRWALLGLAAGVVGLGIKYSVGVIELAALALASLSQPGEGVRTSRAVGRTAALVLPPLVGFGLWLVFTDPAQVVYFFFGHPSYAPLLSRENLFFFPRALLGEFFVSPWVAVVTLGLAVIGARSAWRSFTARFAAFVAAVSWALLTASTTNESRHAILVVPAVAFLASAGTRALGAAWRLRSEGAITLVSLPIWLWAGLVASGAPSWAVGLPAAIRDSLEGAPELDGVMGFVSRRVDPSSAIIANGLFDQLGPDSFRWRIVRDRGGAIAAREVRIARYPVDPALASMAARRGFGIDPLWADRTLAGATFGDVAVSGRFRHVVQIVDRLGELPNARWEEVARVCRDHRVGRLDLGRWTVIVSDLARTAPRAPP